MATKRHYVYIHRKSTTGEVFYVGKGYGKRAWKKSTRSEWWKRIEAKHGRTVEILKDDLTEDEAFALEKETILRYGRLTLCNLNDGGSGGTNPSEITRRKLSEARTGVKFTASHVEKLRLASTGRKHSDATRAKLRDLYLGKPGRPHSNATKRLLSNQRKGVTFTAEHCAKISATKTGMPGTKKSAIEREAIRQRMLGNIVSDETRRKISASTMGRTHSAEALLKITASNRFNNEKRKKIVICSNGLRFACSGDAANWLRDNGFPTASRCNIISCCTGKLKTAYGFTWSHA